jgi:hypothetical protein
VINLAVSITGADAARRALPTTAQMERVIHDALTEWAKETLDGDLYGTQNYAPPPPNSTYVRTGRLGANWGLRRAGKLSVAFTNATPYAGYVVGGNDGGGQAAVHVGRWWIAYRRIINRVDALERKVQAGVDAL